MEVSRLLEFYWQALLPSVNRLEKTLPRLYQTGEGFLFGFDFNLRFAPVDARRLAHRD